MKRAARKFTLLLLLLGIGILPQESTIWLRFRNSTSSSPIISRIYCVRYCGPTTSTYNYTPGAWAIEMPILCPQDRVGKEFLRSSSPLFTANIFLGMTVVLCCSKEEPDNLPLTLESTPGWVLPRCTPRAILQLKKVQFPLEKFSRVIRGKISIT